MNPSTVKPLSGAAGPAQARPPEQLAIRGDVFSCLGDPGDQVDANKHIQFVSDGWLMIRDGVIAGVESAQTEPGADWLIHDRRGQLICPGFIDTHVHSGQLDVIASYGADLLQWLERYTFPNEMRFAQREVAEHESRAFCNALLASGTTTALVFPTVHPESVDGLFEAANERGMCVIAGKVLMNRHCPDALSDPADAGEKQSRQLIERWHQKGRLHYAITPRFAPTSTDAQLALAGRLLQDYPTLYMQTHVAENRDEVEWVRQLFPDDRSYLAVYDRHGLLGPRSVFAHAIWLDNDDRQRLADSGASIAFSPASNLFLGSGLLDVQACYDQEVAVTLASDVGGGTHLSMLRNMASASNVMALGGQKLTAFSGFYMATLGAAKALGLAHQLGHFQAGAFADIVALDWAADSVQKKRQDRAKTLHERLFALMLTGDHHNVAATYVQGKLQCDLS